MIYAMFREFSKKYLGRYGTQLYTFLRSDKEYRLLDTY